MTLDAIDALATLSQEHNNLSEFVDNHDIFSMITLEKKHNLSRSDDIASSEDYIYGDVFMFVSMLDDILTQSDPMPEPVRQDEQPIQVVKSENDNSMSPEPEQHKEQERDWGDYSISYECAKTLSQTQDDYEAFINSKIQNIIDQKHIVVLDSLPQQHQLVSLLVETLEQEKNKFDQNKIDQNKLDQNKLDQNKLDQNSISLQVIRRQMTQMLKHDYYKLGDDVYLKYMSDVHSDKERLDIIVAILDEENNTECIVQDAQKRIKNMRIDFGFLESQIQSCRDVGHFLTITDSNVVRNIHLFEGLLECARQLSLLILSFDYDVQYWQHFCTGLKEILKIMQECVEIFKNIQCQGKDDNYYAIVHNKIRMKKEEAIAFIIQHLPQKDELIQQLNEIIRLEKAAKTYGVCHESINDFSKEVCEFTYTVQQEISQMTRQFQIFENNERVPCLVEQCDQLQKTTLSNVFSLESEFVTFWEVIYYDECHATREQYQECHTTSEQYLCRFDTIKTTFSVSMEFLQNVLQSIKTDEEEITTNIKNAANYFGGEWKLFIEILCDVMRQSDEKSYENKEQYALRDTYDVRSVERLLVTQEGPRIIKSQIIKHRDKYAAMPQMQKLMAKHDYEPKLKQHVDLCCSFLHFCDQASGQCEEEYEIVTSNAQYESLYNLSRAYSRISNVDVQNLEMQVTRATMTLHSMYFGEYPRLEKDLASILAQITEFIKPKVEWIQLRDEIKSVNSKGENILSVVDENQINKLQETVNDMMRNIKKDLENAVIFNCAALQHKTQPSQDDILSEIKKCRERKHSTQVAQDFFIKCYLFLREEDKRNGAYIQLLKHVSDLVWVTRGVDTAGEDALFDLLFDFQFGFLFTPVEYLDLVQDGVVLEASYKKKRNSHVLNETSLKSQRPTQLQYSSSIVSMVFDTEQWFFTRLRELLCNTQDVEIFKNDKDLVIATRFQMSKQNNKKNKLCAIHDAVRTVLQNPNINRNTFDARVSTQIQFVLLYVHPLAKCVKNLRDDIVSNLSFLHYEPALKNVHKNTTRENIELDDDVPYKIQVSQLGYDSFIQDFFHAYEAQHGRHKLTFDIKLTTVLSRHKKKCINAIVDIDGKGVNRDFLSGYQPIINEMLNNISTGGYTRCANDECRLSVKQGLFNGEDVLYELQDFVRFLDLFDQESLVDHKRLMNYVSLLL